MQLCFKLALTIKRIAFMMGLHILGSDEQYGLYWRLATRHMLKLDAPITAHDLS